MRNVTLEERIVVFKTLVISKIVFLAPLTNIIQQMLEELEKIQISSLRKDFGSKIKHETTRKNYKAVA